MRKEHAQGDARLVVRIASVREVRQKVGQGRVQFEETLADERQECRGRDPLGRRRDGDRVIGTDVAEPLRVHRLAVVDQDERAASKGLRGALEDGIQSSEVGNVGPRRSHSEERSEHD